MPFDDLKPLVLFEYEQQPREHCLLLSDNHMVAQEALFNDRGFDGNGYGWSGVAQQALRAHAPELAGRMSFDPEAGTFVAYGADPEALHTLGLLLKRALEDDAFLITLIEGADPEWLD